MESGDIKDDLKLSTEEGDKEFVNRLRDSFEHIEKKTIILNVISALGQEKIVDYKEIA